MTTIRGKAALELTHSPKVIVAYDVIRIETGGWINGQAFKAQGNDRVRQLNGNVMEAEKPLP
jgi:hypothetical protein